MANDTGCKTKTAYIKSCHVLNTTDCKHKISEMMYLQINSGDNFGKKKLVRFISENYQIILM